MQYCYFHGFASSPEAKKSLIMKDFLGKENIQAPDFNFDNAIAVKGKLDSLVDDFKGKELTIIGSSLGGLYALYVSSLAKVRCILLNPCLFPQLVITNITDDYNIDDIVLAQQLSLVAYSNYEPQLVRVWLTTDDDVINHEFLTRPFFHKAPSEIKVFPKDISHGHDFEGFELALKGYL